jgi:hypothetical protein
MSVSTAVASTLIVLPFSIFSLAAYSRTSRWMASHVSSVIALMFSQEDGLRGVLAHLEPGKAPEGIRVLQMEGELFIRQLPVLLEDGASQHLLGRHPLPAGVGATCRGEVFEHPVHDRRSGIENVGDALELLHDRASHDGGEKVHLGVELVSHFWCPRERDFQCYQATADIVYHA